MNDTQQKPAAKLFDYQVKGIDLICNKYKDVLLADHPGAGKTCQVIIASDKLSCKKIIVICPASLRENWKREFKKWSGLDRTCTICMKMEDLLKGDVLIMSYEFATKYSDGVYSCLLVLDEAHYLKTPDSARTKACLDGYWKKAKKRIAITGTPLPNGRAIEGFALFSKLSPIDFGKKREYLDRYCVRDATPWGVNYNKSKNLEVLGRICRDRFMIRRKRSETVGQLPELVRMKVPLDGFPAWDDIDIELDFSKELPEDVKSAWRAHGIAKIGAACAYIKTLLNEVKNCVVFAHHKDVITGLVKGLSGVSCCVVNGETDIELRQECVDRFQKGDIQVFIASLHAASTGITLTAASNVVFVECDWVPSTNEQAEGRCYRISQTNVTRSHYLVIPDSLDDTITGAVMRKQRDITKVLGE